MRLTTLKGILAEFREWNIRLVTDTTGPSLTFILALSLDLAILLPLGIYLHATGQVPLEVLLFFIITLPSFTDSLFHWLYPMVENQAGVVEASRRVRMLLEEKPLQEPNEPRKPLGYDIRFEKVRFAYGESEVIRGVSFSIPERTVTALVGPSGAGKTTLTSLLARFHDVHDGEITIGGVDIRHMRMEDLMASLSIVFQDVVLFNETVAENIRRGRPGASDDEVTAAARLARCEEFVQALPSAYATMLGDRGSRLSEGQKQRISIARAILKNAPILILDEATAYVDPNSERQIQAALSELAKGKTVITVAHRLATIADADQILVIEGGTIVERGRHDVLLELQGRYWKMWRAQMEARDWRL